MIINKRIYGERIEKLPPEWIFLGAGNNGVVYSISKDKVIKIFREDKICDSEGDILLRVHGNKYFPKIIELGENYIVREKVDGRCLKEIIKEDGLSKKNSDKLVDLLHEFMELGFSRIDVRLKDIYIDENEGLMLIDPKGYYTRQMSYPKHLCKGLTKHGGLNCFLNSLFEKDQELYRWSMENLYRPDDDDDGFDGNKAWLLKKLKKKKGKVDSYNLFGEDFSSLNLIPLLESKESDGDVNFIDITEIENLL